MTSYYDVVVAGRKNEGTGIGSLAWSLLDSLEGFVSTKFIDAKKSVPRYKAKFGVYVDVLENYSGDKSYLALEGCKMKGAYVFFDSDKLPESWVKILNSYFDFVFVSSHFLVETLKRSGVEKPVFKIPLRYEYDINAALISSRFNSNQAVKFLSIGAFHPRKNHRKLVQSFVEEFGDSSKVSLRIHSNLDFEKSYSELTAFIKANNVKNILLSRGNLPQSQIGSMMLESDVFVSLSKGEGYGIPLHQALAQNKIAVALDTAAYHELESPRLIKIPAKIKQYAYYPEINYDFYGYQYDGYVADTTRALRQAYDRVVAERKTLQKRTTNPFLEEQFAAKYLIRSFFKPVEVKAGDVNKVAISAVTIRDSEFRPRYEAVFEEPLISQSKFKKVVVGHDGGFFSLFNTYFSHLVWDHKNGGVRYVLPDWSVKTIQTHHNLNKFTSFCYGRVEDENVWTKLFDSPYEEIPESELNNPRGLYSDSSGPEHDFNAKNEPNLTYIHAAKLYSSPDFQYWRQWYNGYFNKFIRLKTSTKATVDRFVAEKMTGKFVVCAHIRHPSHAMEQPDGKLPTVQRYLEKIYALEKAGTIPKDWSLFVATDQEKVIQSIKDQIGDRLIYVDAMARTTIAQDNRFDSLSAQEKLKEGAQIQHLKAQDSQSWSTDLAEQVIIDAYLLSKGQVFLHAVSNVATVVSFINADVKMVRVLGV